MAGAGAVALRVPAWNPTFTDTNFNVFWPEFWKKRCPRQRWTQQLIEEEKKLVLLCLLLVCLLLTTRGMGPMEMVLPALELGAAGWAHAVS